MTDAEIKTMWRNRALKDKDMIVCLSQLDACEYHEMRDRIEKLGLIKKGQHVNFRYNKSIYAEKDYKVSVHPGPLSDRHWSIDELREAMRMRDKGFTYVEIGKILERTPNACKNAMARLKENAI